MHLTAKKDFSEAKEKGLKSIYPPETKVTIGMATCGRASGADEVIEAIRNEVSSRGLNIIVTPTGCMGICQKEPLVNILKFGWPKIVYQQIDTQKAREIISALAEGKIIPKYTLCKIEEEPNLIENITYKYKLNGLPQELEKVQFYQDIPFFRKQHKRVLQNCGIIDPDKIEEYFASGGYLGLFKALGELSPDKVIDEVVRSGIRGRGGAGFPTGRKWSFAREAKGDPKYVICNADEGDPGAYMDRSILEGNPHLVIEGMIIGAYAIGAQHGIIYVRAEYPLAIEKLILALSQACEFGLLGNNILGSGFDFDISIERGSGAFVCGEETALIASIEGTTGEPRPRPPFPAQMGLWGKPTNINNVKTWANIPLIISRGADWFSEIGTEKSKGTMIFSMVGNVKTTGLIEVPMGMTLNELVFDIGGGVPGKRKLKAVQTGGPSGGCIPNSLMDLPVDYDKLAEVGSIMGSGGMVVMDETACMVNVAKYFLAFTKDESCGKCTPCREGTKRMFEVLMDITEGRGKEGDIELLEDMSKIIIDSALCALGGTAPNPVLTTIRYFREEYEEHIKNKRCPAGVCKGLFEYWINPDECNGCGLCLKNCPANAVTGDKKRPHKIVYTECIHCGLCREACPANAIMVK
ncbi:MAG: NADH-quinone oxidoreductase subunit NuoF [Thermodesulfobacteriota bacterium]|jgi:NADH:ubiquinone oxidoreductase subunit F (NADH-binding)/(2Fe-2S) ferredoxin|nr:MAG: NADH-quinone oxidoreductase subunit NuoF [Thermodesulfobacteriota bacterium]